ncbi:MAG: LysR family transcriptional regulator [Hyphomicrobiales bacterium]
MAQRLPLDVDLLRSFLSVEQTGSFSRAAEILGRSQPAISLQIKRLEDRAGVVLFDRSRSGEVRLTPAGATLVRYAHEILALHDDAVASLAAPAMKSRVRLGILEELGHTRLPQILRAFNRAIPRGNPQIQVSLSNQLVNDLLQNRLDLAVVAGDRNYPQGVMAWSETVTWVASSAVPLALRQPLPLVLLPEPCWYRRSAIQVLDEARMQWMQSCLSTTMTGIRATVIAGLGLTVMGDSEVGEGLRAVGNELNLPRLPPADIMVYYRTRDFANAAKALATEVRAFL